MNTIAITICVVLNCASLIAFFLIIVNWMDNLERKIDSIRCKQSTLNVHCLFFIKMLLEKDGNIGQAKIVEEIIKKEMEE